MASETITLSYRVPAQRIPRIKAGTQGSAFVASSVDLRPGDPCLLMEKITMGGGAASGVYLAPEPVSRIVDNAVTQALEAAGLDNAGEASTLHISIEITSLDFTVMVGFARCLLRGELRAAVHLVDSTTGDTVWQGVCQGVGRGGTGNLVPAVFTDLLDDFVVNLLAGPAFSA